jgi:hypothetical protein
MGVDLIFPILPRLIADLTGGGHQVALTNGAMLGRPGARTMERRWLRISTAPAPRRRAPKLPAIPSICCGIAATGHRFDCRRQIPMDIWSSLTKMRRRRGRVAPKSLPFKRNHQRVAALLFARHGGRFTVRKSNE